MSDEQDINRIKIVLVEKKRSNKWLAQELGKDPATVSKWCTNTTQPDCRPLQKWRHYLMLILKTYYGQQDLNSCP